MTSTRGNRISDKTDLIQNNLNIEENIYNLEGSQIIMLRHAVISL